MNGRNAVEVLGGGGGLSELWDGAYKACTLMALDEGSFLENYAYFAPFAPQYSERGLRHSLQSININLVKFGLRVRKEHTCCAWRI
jgi:hypothetical protein